MIKEFTGKTLDEALEAASAELGISKEEIKYTEAGESGFLGLFKSVKIEVEVADAAETVSAAEETGANIADAIVETATFEARPKSDKPAEQIAEEFVASVLSKMGLEANVSAAVNREENTVYVDIEGPDMGTLIGKRGQTLDSLQYLTSLVVNRNSDDEYLRVKLDTENYRARRKDTLENLAKNISNKVRKTRRPVTLEPMNPYERRIIHSALQGDKYVETHSEGEEPYRKIVVTLKKDAPLDRRYQDRRGGGRNNGRRGGGRYGQDNYYNKKKNYPRHNEQSDDYSQDYKADYAAYLAQKEAARNGYSVESETKSENE